MHFRGIVVLAAVITGCGSSTEPSGACAAATALTIGASATGKSGSDECSLPDGSAGKFYTLSLSATTGFLLTMTPSGFTGSIGLYSGSPTNPGKATVIFTEGGTGTVGGRAFLPAGQYFIGAGRVGQAGGGFTISTSVSENTDCVFGSWTVLGTPLTGSLTATDCAGALGSSQDIYQVRMTAGQSVVITAAVSKPGGVIWGTSSASIIERPLSSPTGGSTTITYKATVDGVYLLHFLTNSPTTATATYTGIIQ